MPAFEPHIRDRAIPLPPAPEKRQFRARVVKPWGGCHALEIYIEAQNIYDAAHTILDKLSPMGVTADQLTTLVEIEKR